MGEIVAEMDYLRTREQKLRDTNESTNERVKWFAFGTMGMLVGLGAWQVVYLRAYFRYAAVEKIARIRNCTNLSQVKAPHMITKGLVLNLLYHIILASGFSVQFQITTTHLPH